MQALVDSIVENIDVTILIVDNASTNETYQELELVRDERVYLLRSEKNLGFTGGINWALKHTIEESFQMVNGIFPSFVFDVISKFIKHEINFTI